MSEHHHHNDFDVIVIGGGHAGAEAASAAARLGARTALLTISIDAVGRMSCNPAIGGQAKGQIVREIDALGGIMARVTDATGIQFRMLNRSKGPAMWSPRAQADKHAYSAEVRRVLESTPNLILRQEMAEELIVEPTVGGRRVAGVLTQSGMIYRAKAVIVTTGTFLRGLIHMGERNWSGGRIGESAAAGLSGSLAKLGFELGRLKTGTPPRLHKRSIDFAKCGVQPGDDPPTPFSHATERITQTQLCCWTTETTPAVHEAIRANLHRAPMYSGQIKSRGPRYCPSIEDKVVRFADKERHQIFLEPEGRHTDEVYCNGISTSLPQDVQEQIVRNCPGLERAEIVRYGYAIEYDFAPPTQVSASLETKTVEGLFLAGQINGTTGYEEAAAQGLMAGINAARRLTGKPAVTLGRDRAYIGVLIDDLTTLGTDEPYRMFTSRAEYRLHLRTDNADRRLMRLGHEIGLIDSAMHARLLRKEEQIAAALEFLHRRREGSMEGKTWAELIRRPDATLAEFAAREPMLAALPKEVAEEVEIEVKYEGYLRREHEQMEKFRRMEAKPIPESFDFSAIKELDREAREKLCRVRPRSLGQAGRISGISPADIAVLMVKLKANRASASASTETR
jgi:tRNA uridine 5-carboxymethylaminomethyl modification enzyme